MSDQPHDPLSIELLYSPQDPTAPQHAFLLLDDLGIFEAFYGGAAGGGKSSALIMSALRYVDVPGYAALLLRKSYADLALPGALMDRAKEWLTGVPGIRWSETLFRFTFPSGATLSFGYLQSRNDKYRYQGAELQFIGFDELTQFDKDDFRYLFTRLRKPSGIADDHPLAHVPLRMRSAANPGGRGHEWVKSRYIDRKPDPDDPEDTPAEAARRIFIPALLTDNQHVDQETYKKSLRAVDPHLRQQMLAGDWHSRPPGAWVYDHHGIEAAAALGRDFDALLAAGRMSPPAGGLLAMGIDWGEHTHGLIGWPLEGGGLYVAAGLELVGSEPAESARVLVGGTDDDGRWHDGLLGQVVRRGQLAPAGMHPALPSTSEALELVSDHRYDAAGVQSMRTYMAHVRRRYRQARTTAVAFGAPVKSGGTGNQTRSYKAETINHLRRLFRRTAEGRESGIIAISPHAADLLRQLPLLQFADEDLGIVAKGDDHGPDALIALDAPNARANR